MWPHVPCWWVLGFLFSDDSFLGMSFVQNQGTSLAINDKLFGVEFILFTADGTLDPNPWSICSPTLGFCQLIVLQTSQTDGMRTLPRPYR